MKELPPIEVDANEVLKKTELAVVVVVKENLLFRIRVIIAKALIGLGCKVLGVKLSWIKIADMISDELP